MSRVSDGKGHRCKAKGCPGYTAIKKTWHDNQAPDSNKRPWTKRRRVCRVCKAVQYTIEYYIECRVPIPGCEKNKFEVPAK